MLKMYYADKAVIQYVLLIDKILLCIVFMCDSVANATVLPCDIRTYNIPHIYSKNSNFHHQFNQTIDHTFAASVVINSIDTVSYIKKLYCENEIKHTFVIMVE